MHSIRLKVEECQKDSRLDQFLASAVPQLSRRRIREIIAVGGVYLNKKRIKTSGRKLTSNDNVSINWQEGEIERLRLLKNPLTFADILYEDSEIVAINKPAMVPSQPTKTQDKFHMLSLVKELLGNRSRRTDLYAVHRLDKPTTGVMLFAKTKLSMKKLTHLFVDRKINKTYLGLVSKEEVEQSSWSCQDPIGSIDSSRGRVWIDNNGKPAETHFEIIASKDHCMIVRATPETGRTHQIRVHLEKSGLPLLNDKVYGGEQLNDINHGKHFVLHAELIKFDYWKTKKPLTIKASHPLLHSNN